MTSNIIDSRLQLHLEVGEDEDGFPIYKKKTFSDLKTDCLDEKAYKVALALSGLQESLLSSVRRLDSKVLEEI